MHPGSAKRHRDPLRLERAVPLSLFGLTAMVLGTGLMGCSPKSKGLDFDAGMNVMVLPDGAIIYPPGKESELPSGFKPRVECGNLGITCKDSKPCGADLLCESGVCVPDPRSREVRSCREGGCPAESPFCAFGVCLTPDQLGCVCLDRQGREKAYQCEGILPNAGDACLSEEMLCDGRPDGCCEGLTCMQGTGTDGKPNLNVCMKPCDADNQCDSLCCADNKDITGTFCGSTFEACRNSCRRLDEECDANRNPCCQGLVCAQSTQDLGLNGCQVPCTLGTECTTGCCVLFTLPDGGAAERGVCAPADRCVTL